MDAPEFYSGVARMGLGFDDEHEKYLGEHEDIGPDEDYEMELHASDRKKVFV